MKSLKPLFIIAYGLFTAEIFAQNTRGPVYVSKMPLTHYSLFANGGWDGNWFVGYNQGWIEKLTLNHKKEDFSKAYIGAKLGRMKSLPKAGRPSWIREAIKSEIFVAVSKEPRWSADSYRLLTKTDDIPLAYDYENALEDTGEARWYWTEIPLDSLNFAGDNYAILWSPDEFLTSVSSAPILAAAWGDKNVDSWITTEISGNPKNLKDDSQKTPITIFEPAIALKLIPKNVKNEIMIEITAINDIINKPGFKNIQAVINGVQIERAYLELSSDGKTWNKISKILYGPPYFFTFDPEKAPEGKILIRVAAVDVWENVGYSRAIEMTVSKSEEGQPKDKKGKKGK